MTGVEEMFDVWVQSLLSVIAVVWYVSYLRGAVDPEDPFAGRMVMFITPLIFLNSFFAPFPYLIPRYFFLTFLAVVVLYTMYITHEAALAVLVVFLVLGNVASTMKAQNISSLSSALMVSVVVALSVFFYYSPAQASDELANTIMGTKKSKYYGETFLVQDDSIFHYPVEVALIMGGYTLFLLRVVQLGY